MQTVICRPAAETVLTEGGTGIIGLVQPAAETVFKEGGTGIIGLVQPAAETVFNTAMDETIELPLGPKSK